MTVREHGSPSRRPPMLAMAAAVAVALSGCGGGGGPSTPVPPPEGRAGPVSTGPFSKGAEGAEFTVSRAHGATAPSFTFLKRAAKWTTPSGSASHRHLTLPSAAAARWAGTTRGNLVNTPDERIAVYSDIEQATATGEADGDYLVFGHWNRLGSNGRIEPFYWGPKRYDGPLPTTDTTGYTYSGAAAGGYRGPVQTGEVVPSIGHFTSDFTMSANFGALGGPTVNATFSNFKVRPVTAAAAPSAGAWSVPSADLVVTGNSFKDEDWNSGGKWSAMFFGPSGSGAAPTGIAGVFEDVPVPTATDFSLTGAFAASRP